MTTYSTVTAPARLTFATKGRLLVANSSIMAGSARTSASAIALPRIRFPVKMNNATRAVLAALISA